jgi:hypothetical protein
MEYIIVDTHPDTPGAILLGPVHSGSPTFKEHVLPVYGGAAYGLAIGEELPDPTGYTAALRRVAERVHAP